jgi:predicted ArsR family transcriptional regulator
MDALAVLQDPVRRGLYAHVRDAYRPITREQASAALGISRKLAAFHLDKLVEAGLLVGHPEAAARTRKVGRTPKVYETSGTEIQINIPAREHVLLADILLDAILREGATGPTAQAVVRTAAERGQQLGRGQGRPGRAGRLGTERALALAEEALQELGFQPSRESPTSVALRNCPFHPLAAKAPELVCELNRAFIAGYLAGIDGRTVDAVLEPRPGQCCVRLRTRPKAALS